MMRMPVGPFAGRRWWTGLLVVGTGALGLALLLGVPGCGTGTVPVDEFASLFDADSAFVVGEWSLHPAEEQESTGACESLARTLLGETAAPGEEETAEGAKMLHDAASRLLGLLGEHRLLEGKVFYGAMIAPPEEESPWPSSADLLVARPTKEGREAIAAFLDALGTRSPEFLRRVDGAEPPEWVAVFPFLGGEARIRLGATELRAAFGSGSLAEERDRLVEGRPAAHPLGNVLPEPLSEGAWGMRAWVRPRTMAGPLAEALRRGLADLDLPTAAQGNPLPGMLARAARDQAPGFVEEFLGSFAEIRSRNERFEGSGVVRLSENVSPVVQLFHDREGSISPELLAGVPLDAKQVVALQLPPLDELVLRLVDAISPEMAPVLKAQLDQPLPLGPQMTVRELLQALGPGLVFWRENVGTSADDGTTVPVEQAGLLVQLREPQKVRSVLKLGLTQTGFSTPDEDGEVLAWKAVDASDDHGARPAVVVTDDFLLSAPRQETADAIRARSGGLGGDPAMTGAIEALAGGRPVGFVQVMNMGAIRREFEEFRKLAERSSSREGSLLDDVVTCLGGFVSLPDDGRILSVGTRTDDGFRWSHRELPAPAEAGATGKE